MTNIGGKVSCNDYKHGSPPERTFQPTLLKLGAVQNFVLGKKQNVLMFTLDANKLLVPTVVGSIRKFTFAFFGYVSHIECVNYTTNLHNYITFLVLISSPLRNV